MEKKEFVWAVVTERRDGTGDVFEEKFGTAEEALEAYRSERNYHCSDISENGDNICSLCRNCVYEGGEDCDVIFSFSY